MGTWASTESEFVPTVPPKQRIRFRFEGNVVLVDAQIELFIREWYAAFPKKKPPGVTVQPERIMFRPPGVPVARVAMVLRPLLLAFSRVTLSIQPGGSRRNTRFKGNPVDCFFIITRNSGTPDAMDPNRKI